VLARSAAYGVLVAVIFIAGRAIFSDLDTPGDIVFGAVFGLAFAALDFVRARRKTAKTERR